MASVRTMGLGLVLAGSVGLAAELALTEHWHDVWQYTPFVLCTALAAAAVVSLRTSAASTPVRIVAGIVTVGACVGVGQHLWANAMFTAEIRPTLTTAELFGPAWTGASPALAPGALGLLAAFLWLFAPLPTNGAPPR